MPSIEINIYAYITFFSISILIFLYLGWKIRKIYKNFIFYLFKVRGRNAEKKAIKILKKNGYQILNKQPIAKGYLYQNKKQISFIVRPDFRVSKNNIVYIAEVKSGMSASIQDIGTRRQLLEYSIVFNSNKLILVDTKKNKIKKIEF